MRAAVFRGPGSLQVRDLPSPRATSGEVTVDVAACGICGSDLHVMAGHVKVPAPLTLGHELSGRIHESEVAGLTPGQRVTVMPLLPCGQCDLCRNARPNLCRARIDVGLMIDGGFADRLAIPRASLGSTIFALPDNVSDIAGALVEPLAVGMRAAAMAGAAPHCAVLVFGAGMIGQAAITFLALSGAAPIVALDPSRARREQARARGAHAVCSPEELADVASDEGPPHGFDAVLDCAGHKAVPPDALRHVKPGGTLVLAAVYGQRVPLSLDRIVGGELVVRGSFAYVEEFGRVIELIADGVVDAESFVGARFPLERVEDAFGLQAAADHATKVLVSPTLSD